MITIENIAQEQTSHWTDLDFFLIYDFHKIWDFLTQSAAQRKLFPFRFSMNTNNSEVAGSEELDIPGGKLLGTGVLKTKNQS